MSQSRKFYSEQMARAKRARQEREKAEEKQRAEQQLLRRRGGALFGALAGTVIVAPTSAPSGANIERRATIATGNALQEANANMQRVRRDVPLPPKFVPRKARSMSQVYPFT